MRAYYMLGAAMQDSNIQKCTTEKKSVPSCGLHLMEGKIKKYKQAKYVI